MKFSTMIFFMEQFDSEFGVTFYDKGISYSYSYFTY